MNFTLCVLLVYNDNGSVQTLCITRVSALCTKCLHRPIVIINQQYTKGEIHFINVTRVVYIHHLMQTIRNYVTRVVYIHHLMQTIRHYATRVVYIHHLMQTICLYVIRVVYIHHLMHTIRNYVTRVVYIHHLMQTIRLYVIRVVYIHHLMQTICLYVIRVVYIHHLMHTIRNYVTRVVYIHHLMQTIRLYVTRVVYIHHLMQTIRNYVTRVVYIHQIIQNTLHCRPRYFSVNHSLLRLQRQTQKLQFLIRKLVFSALIFRACALKEKPFGVYSKAVTRILFWLVKVGLAPVYTKERFYDLTTLLLPGKTDIGVRMEVLL